MALLEGRKRFARNKSVVKNPTELYVWYVDTDLAQTNVKNGGKPKPFCNATKGSQGYDNITGYVYQLIVVNGMQEKLAYVECNYVQ